MNNFQRLASLALGVPFLVGMAGTAYADSGSATLDELNDSGASGTATVTVTGNRVDVTVSGSGMLADNPHAQHIHFDEQARHECPTMAEDANDDGRLDTTEGAPAYGAVAASLTTKGDTSADSVLAVNRFPTAPGGSLEYNRSFQVSSEVAQAIMAGEAAVVVHGLDYNGSGKYDGKAKSDLDPSLPAEATDPALCGVVMSAPGGGVAAGAGGASGTVDAGLLGLGGGLLLLAGSAGAFALRRARA